MFLESARQALQSQLPCDLRHMSKSVKAEGDHVGGRTFDLHRDDEIKCDCQSCCYIRLSLIREFSRKFQVEKALFPRGRRSIRPRNAEENFSH